jgi:hypothetical protein
MSEHITVEKRGTLLLVGINRVDKRNAFDVPTHFDFMRTRIPVRSRFRGSQGAPST